MTVLEQIIEHKKRELEIRKKEKPLSSFQDKITESQNFFFDALQGKNRVHLIAELKLASPSKGQIAQLQIDPRKEPENKEAQQLLLKTLQDYNKYASCVSVLTDTKYFGGCHKNLKLASQNSHLPLLCKDFFIDEYQIYEARFYGANAVLLMASVLSTKEMQNLYKIVQELKMDALFEVHDEAELESVLQVAPAEPKIIGVNNRNLKDLSINKNLTRALADKVPANCIAVAESGIDCRDDVENVKGSVDAMLVGSSIMAADSATQKLAELTRLPEIKICGITNLEDALESAKCGASYLGFIFAQSSRQVTQEQVAQILPELKAKYPNIKTVGVFVNNPKCFEIAKNLELDVVQLHGDETEAFVQENKKDFFGEVWKVVFVPSRHCEEPSDEAIPYEIDLNKANFADKLLFDTACAARGGSGKTFDWNVIARSLATKQSPMLQIGIAGGLNPNNVQEARETGIQILDVSSGVEETKGKKSFQKLKELFWKLKK